MQNNSNEIDLNKSVIDLNECEQNELNATICSFQPAVKSCTSLLPANSFCQLSSLIKSFRGQLHEASWSG